MDTPGEDSGFGYEDPLNLLEEGSHGISVNVSLWMQFWIPSNTYQLFFYIC